MKKKYSAICAAVMTACAVSASYSVNAADDVIYGTMNIPYADFYRAELAGSGNAYEVDAVSSATTSKWSMNGEGKLFEGTYNQANEDGTGTILGVTYPVAISQSELDALGSDNYSFTRIDYEPQAYKNVTVTDGKAVFSEVQDSTPVAFNTDVILSTNTAWGDYLLDFKSAPEDMGAILGAVVKTSNGNSYGMRHEENIWRGELAWSSGIKTTEPHGNALSYENFRSLMGETVTEVTFITNGGYYSVATETYIPVKFADGEAVVENGKAGTSSTSLTVKGFPSDYAKSYIIGENFVITDNTVSYTNAAAGSYTLTISDSNGKYADVTASFMLTTDEMPAEYKDEKITAKAGASAEEFANFMKNISKVSVNGKDYSAAGKGAVKIIAEDGSIDFTAKSRDDEVFDGSGNYAITVTATGYNTPLEIEIKKEEPVVTTIVAETTVTTTSATADTTTDKETTAAAKSTTTKATTKSNTTAAKADSNASSPKTGDTSAVPALCLTASALAGAAFVTRKKK